jgi:hypothetical protein
LPGAAGANGLSLVDSGWVLANGTVNFETVTTGTVTVTRTSAGHYTLQIVGLGSHRIFPMLTGANGSATVYFDSPIVGGGVFSANVLTSNGLDQDWFFSAVGNA